MTYNQKLYAYLAAPLFNEQERSFNLHLERILLPFLNMFVPQRDGYLLSELVRQGHDIIEPAFPN